MKSQIEGRLEGGMAFQELSGKSLFCRGKID